MARDISARIRAEVAARVGHRCEYCLISEEDAGFPHHVDHIVSRKHGGGDEESNLAYACFLCNRRKGSDVASLRPGTVEPIRLFHPRRDIWTEHFHIDGPLIQPVSTVGEVSVKRHKRIDRSQRRRFANKPG